MYLVPLYSLIFLISVVLSMPWPIHIVTMFESIPVGALAGATDEAVLYGPINMLLVHRQISTLSRLSGKNLPRASLSTLPRCLVQHPVFFLEVKPAGSFSHSARAATDNAEQI
jgi:hypothetical protein